MPSVDIIPGSCILYCHLRPVLLCNYNVIRPCTADGYWNPIPMILALCTVVSRKKLTYRNHTYKSTNKFSQPFICTTSVLRMNSHEPLSVLQAYCKRTTHVRNIFCMNSCR